MVPEPTSSGLDVLDRAWGGLRPGAAHLVYGPADSGRDRLALHLAWAAVERGGTCLFVSPEHAPEIARRGEALGFDVEAACAGGRLRLLATDPAALSAADDQALGDALAELAGLVCEAAPDLTVLDGLAPLLRFQQPGALREALRTLLGALHQGGVTTVLLLGEPASEAARQLVAFLRAETEATLRLDAWNPTEAPPPNIAPVSGNDGHAGGGAAEPDLRVTPPAPSEPEDALSEPVQEEAPDATPPASDDEPTEPAEPVDEAETPPAESASPIRYVDARTPFQALPLRVDTFEARTRQVPAQIGTARTLATGATDPGRPARTPPLAADPFARATRPLIPSGTPEAAGAAEERPPRRPRGIPTQATAAPRRPSEPFRHVTLIPSPAPAFAPQHSVAAFADALDAAIKRAETPFLVLALRLSSSAPGHFRLIAGGLSEGLQEGDLLALDEAQRRLAVLLPGRRAEATSRVFGRLKHHLQRVAPAEATLVLRSLSTIVVPNGEPFRSAEEFFAYAFEEP